MKVLKQVLKEVRYIIETPEAGDIILHANNMMAIIRKEKSQDKEKLIKYILELGVSEDGIDELDTEFRKGRNRSIRDVILIIKKVNLKYNV